MENKLGTHRVLNPPVWAALDAPQRVVDSTWGVDIQLSGQYHPQPPLPNNIDPEHMEQVQSIFE